MSTLSPSQPPRRRLVRGMLSMPRQNPPCTAYSSYIACKWTSCLIVLVGNKLLPLFEFTGTFLVFAGFFFSLMLAITLPLTLRNLICVTLFLVPLLIQLLKSMLIFFLEYTQASESRYCGSAKILNIPSGHSIAHCHSLGNMLCIPSTSCSAVPRKNQ